MTASRLIRFLKLRVKTKQKEAFSAVRSHFIFYLEFFATLLLYPFDFFFVPSYICSFILPFLSVLLVCQWRSICISLHTDLSVYIYLPTYPSTCVSVSLSIHLSVCLSIDIVYSTSSLFVYPSISLQLSVSIYVYSIVCLHVCSFACLSFPFSAPNLFSRRNSRFCWTINTRHWRISQAGYNIATKPADSWAERNNTAAGQQGQVHIVSQPQLCTAFGLAHVGRYIYIYIYIW